MAAPLAGSLGGVFSGLAAPSGPIVFIYLLATSRDENVFVKLARLYLVFASAVLALVLSRYAHLTFADAGVGLVSVLPVMAGTALGDKIRRHVPIKVVFRLLILSMVIASAVDLVMAPLLPSLAFFASTGRPA